MRFGPGVVRGTVCVSEQTAVGHLASLASYPPGRTFAAGVPAPAASWVSFWQSSRPADAGASANPRGDGGHTLRIEDMNYKLATTCFVIGMAFVPFAVNAADSDADRANPANYVKDSVITTKIKAQLAAEHLGSMKHVSVDTDKNGVVWMTGTANSQEEVDKAVSIARNTEGVKSVKSELTIQKDR
jgi:hyperosmotically inducible protein